MSEPYESVFHTCDYCGISAFDDDWNTEYRACRWCVEAWEETEKEPANE